MAAADKATLADVLKTNYPGGKLPKEALYDQNPFVGMVKKNPRFGGDGVKIPFQYRGGVNPSRTVAGAQTNTRPAGYKGFFIRDDDKTFKIAVARWDRQAIKQTQMGAEQTFVDGVKKEIEAQEYALARDLARYVWGNGGNTLGQISATSNTGTPTITLANPGDAVNFDEGTVVAAANADPGVSGAGTVRVGTATIIAVDRMLGTLTITGNWTASITAVAASDFLFPFDGIDAGAFSVGGYGARGVPAWITDTAPGLTDNFYSVNRSADPVRLAGLRYDATGLDIEEAIQIGGVYLSREGRKGDYVAFVEPRNWHRLVNTATSRTVYTLNPTDGKKVVNVGYQAFNVVTAAGTVKVVADPNQRSTRIHILDMSSWTLYSTGEAPELQMDDGLDWLRVSDQNQYEARLSFDVALACDNPSNNAVITVTAPTF